MEDELPDAPRENKKIFDLQICSFLKPLKMVWCSFCFRWEKEEVDRCSPPPPNIRILYAFQIDFWQVL